MDRTELAWAAGFFDAEGWAGAVKNRRRCHPHAQISQADPCGTPEVLERFQAAVGVGRLGGPARQPGKLDLYRWVASSRADVTAVYTALRPWLGEVKREQFCLSLGIDDRPPERPTANESLAWAAGFFDGDGSTYLAKHRTHAGHYTAEIAITQSSSDGLPGVLRRFQGALLVGRIYGPLPAPRGHAPVYRLKVTRLADVDSILRATWPWLGAAKRVQASAVVATVRSQDPLPRGNPAWGSHKTHCVHGHEYTTARVRPFVSRKGGREKRASQYCLACLREHARCMRAKKIGGSEEPPMISEALVPTC